MKLLKHSQRSALTYTTYDRRYPVVAAELIKEIASVSDIFAVEHIGSTAVSGSCGKGIIDLMALYPEGKLEETKDILLSIGFCKQGDDFAYQWPEDRPMYLGIYNFKGESFTVYIHVLRKDNEEVERFRIFRERLKRDPELLKEYCAAKESLVSEGINDSDEYTKRKGAVISKILSCPN
ncbi:MAG TPA: GrpB family protein [Nitrospirae bacterium]|nr:GrpB family protein [Nitrospirota bacterium]HDZ62183.1 GrpB family protein [Nitrospirota bacterium]